MVLHLTPKDDVSLPHILKDSSRNGVGSPPFGLGIKVHPGVFKTSREDVLGVLIFSKNRSYL